MLLRDHQQNYFFVLGKRPESEHSCTFNPLVFLALLFGPECSLLFVTYHSSLFYDLTQGFVCVWVWICFINNMRRTSDSDGLIASRPRMSKLRSILAGYYFISTLPVHIMMPLKRKDVMIPCHTRIRNVAT